MRVAIIVARAVDCCVGVALASGRAALWVRLGRARIKTWYTCKAVENCPPTRREHTTGRASRRVAGVLGTQRVRAFASQS